MKKITLLIVDDETATREGLRSAIDFEKLGIQTVLEASNGLEGIRIASSSSPDIILSDVRMPRLDGIKMLERIRSFLPGCVFIFMSGFSDKEYLKAAIRLHAVNYVEKPLHFPEVEAAVKEAINLCVQFEEQQNAANIKNTVTASRLALRLTSPVTDRDLYELSYLKERYGKNTRFASAATLLVQMRAEDAEAVHDLSEAEEAIRRIRPRDPLHVMTAEKHPGLFVFHIFRENAFEDPIVAEAADLLSRTIPEGCDFYITCGPIVTAVSKLYDSYSEAALLMEQSYFLPVRSISFSRDSGDLIRLSPGMDLNDSVRAVLDALESEDRTAAGEALSSLYQGLSRNNVFPRHTVTAAYYRIAGQILELRRNSHLPPTELTSSTDTFIYALSSCFSYDEMHALTTAETDSCFKDLESISTESTQVYMIREYIRAHYDEPYLSTKEISDYIMLSASYTCTIFKNETGKTLNQYLTEYRMEKAKKFLSDPRGTVANIAARCGYNDSNYFGKAFKKYTGLSPSEYRDSVIG